MERIHPSHYVCLNCRRAVKAPSHSYFRIGTTLSDRLRLTCAVCGCDMYSVSPLFTPPRKKDEKKLEWMIANGWRGYN
jgi:RNase P subunit RPR2